MIPRVASLPAAHRGLKIGVVRIRDRSQICDGVRLMAHAQQLLSGWTGLNAPGRTEGTRVWWTPEEHWTSGFREHWGPACYPTTSAMKMAASLRLTAPRFTVSSETVKKNGEVKP